MKINEIGNDTAFAVFDRDGEVLLWMDIQGRVVGGDIFPKDALWLNLIPAQVRTRDAQINALKVEVGT